MRQKGFVSIFIFIVFIGLALFGILYNKLNPIPIKDIPLTVKYSPEIRVSSNKRVLFIKNKELFYCDKECKNPKQITGVNVKDSAGFMLSPDGAKLYFVKDNNVWALNTDNLESKKITNNNYGFNELNIILLGANRDNSKAFFSYEVPRGYGDFKNNPAIDYGIYSYDFKLQKVSFFGKLVSKLHMDDFVQLLEDEAIFANLVDGYYYKLNLQNGNFDKFIDRQFSAISAVAFINERLGVVVYTAVYSNGGWQVWKDQTTPENYSQIIMVDYKNNKVTEISPRGTFAQYQGLIVSPKFKYIIYKDNQSGIYSAYNREKNKTTSLTASIYIYSPFWLDEDHFLYWSPNLDELGTVYKYNLRNNNQEVFLENIKKLVN